MARRRHAAQVELGKFFNETIRHLFEILRESSFRSERKAGGGTSEGCFRLTVFPPKPIVLLYIFNNLSN